MLISRSTMKSPKTLQKASSSKCLVPLTSCANFSTFKPKHSSKCRLNIFQCHFQGLSVYFNAEWHNWFFFMINCMSQPITWIFQMVVVLLSTQSFLYYLSYLAAFLIHYNFSEWFLGAISVILERKYYVNVIFYVIVVQPTHSVC